MKARKSFLAVLSTAITLALCTGNVYALFTGAPVPKWAGTTPETLAGFTVKVSSTANLENPLPPGTMVKLTYSNGTTATARVGNDGILDVPPPPVPAGAGALGSTVTISTIPDMEGDQGTTKAKPLKWDKFGWFGGTLGMKIDPLGLPGLTSPQSWFIQETDLVFTGQNSDGLVITGTMTASNFDLSYTDQGGGLFDAHVVGDNSFILLDDATYISFLDDTLFGTLKFLFNDGNTANGLFDFTAIGAAGTWNWDSTSNYTGGETTSSRSFDALAMSSAATPEPSTVVLLSLGFLGLMAFSRRRRMELV